ncbi:MAG: divergent PAP2 family protein [Treponema sp.]|nr:divergent PAP2 family protein [Treponema sp.]
MVKGMYTLKWLESLRAFFVNPVILSALTSWLFSQLVKGIAALLQQKKRGFLDVLETIFWRTGGMPSSHAAVVTSMAAAVGFSEGAGSNLFAVSVFFAMVVLRDAVGVRRAAGLQARALNILGMQTAEKTGIEFHPVKEIKGHAPLEVIVGGLLGIFIAAAFALL